MRLKAKELADYDLLVLTLGYGMASRSCRQLMERLEDYLVRADADPSILTVDKLLEVKGLGVARACALLAAVELGRRTYGKLGKPIIEPEDAFAHFAWMRDLKKEHFYALYLDTRRRLISSETISIGTLDSSLVHPREVFRPAIEQGASALLVAHNHPSGDPEPSAEDLLLTRRLEDAGNILGFTLLDHLVIGRHRFVSIRQRREGSFPEHRALVA